VLADPEALKRALANLIDNAAEAMQSSLLRELTIESGRSRATRRPKSWWPTRVTA
jgi:two-component system nitrogen regulation sensor histidine kinase NtrY